MKNMLPLPSDAMCVEEHLRASPVLFFCSLRYYLKLVQLVRPNEKGTNLKFKDDKERRCGDLGSSGFQ